jgi:hypothetical protein
VQQLTLGEVGEPLKDPAWPAFRDALAEAVRLITPKELCFQLGISAQYLSDALRNTNSKGFRVEWLLAVLRMAPHDARLALLRAMADVAGYMAPERKRELTAAEELAATREAMQRLAPGLLALVDKEIGK